MGYLGDDNCLIGPDQPPTVFSVYESLQLVDGYEKATSHLSERLPEALVLEAELRAIAVVQVSGEQESRIAPATPAAALAALAPSSIFQRPALRRFAFQRLAAIVRSVPCHTLEAGTNPDLLADTVAALL
jgi:hypothetical protein